MNLFQITAPLVSAAIVFTASSPGGVTTPLNHDITPSHDLAFQALAVNVPATQIGVNAGPLITYRYSPAFSNLVFGGVWENAKYAPLADSAMTATGGINYIAPGSGYYRFLTVPYNIAAGTVINCTWTGVGRLIPRGFATYNSSTANSMTFSVQTSSQTGFWLLLTNVNSSHPFENLTCTQVGTAPGTLRAEYVSSLTGYPVIRFMDWQNSNANHPVTWANRHQQGDTRNTDDGVSIEDMMTMANAANASPWFVMPYNADYTYINGFAQYVAAHLPAGKSVYVELGNEIWNVSFQASKQAQQEGVGLHLSNNAATAGLLRYAQRTIMNMQVWEAAFKGRTGLVRVVSTQHANPQTAVTVLTAPGLLAHVDALATAPYWGSTMAGTVTQAQVNNALSLALSQSESLGLQNKAVAKQYGVRYIAYEGGQSLSLPQEGALWNTVQTSPQMYSFYTNFLQWWKSNVGDALVLYTSNGGSYGIVNNDTDTVDQSVKLKAVREAQAAS